MVSKYDPWRRFLAGQRGARVSCTFEQLEDLLDAPLPRTARARPAWWSNHPAGHVQAEAWLDGGWRTRDVDLTRGTITFERQGR